MPAQIHQFPCLDDNYGVLVHDPATGATASIDAPEAGPVLAALAQTGWTLTDILVTHHHKDHIGGIEGVKAKFPQARVVAPAADRERIPGADVYLHEGEEAKVGALTARVVETPGHTSGHIVYHFADEKLLFAGDTLFAMGCGRAFEAPAQTLHASVQKLAGLPDDTQIYCGHEYTQSNGRFALKVDPDNAALKARMEEVDRLRADGKPTLPTTMGLERATNPFLRVDDPGVRRAVGLPDAPAADVFAELRERKNKG
ncbi:MAG TPA: hydroxyacylglutathione hydrolase [Beijerinckiaceae bacterium]